MPGLQVSTKHPLGAINTPASVKRDDGLSGPMLHGHLCGTLDERVVILAGERPLPFDTGDRVLVHTSLRGHAIGFVSTVIAKALLPSPHVFLSFPDDYEELELRNSARLPALIPVQIELGSEPRWVGERAPVDGVMINVSQSGCALSSLEAFGPNDSLTVNVTLPGQPGAYRLDVTVVSRQDSLPVHVHGARFIPSAEVRDSLRGLHAWIARQRPLWPNGTASCPRAV